MKPVRDNRRRQFLKAGVTTAAGLLVPAWSVTRGAPAIIAAESDRPQALQGLQLGDPSDGSLVVRSRGDMTVDLRDINGVSVFSKRLLPRLY